MTMELYTYSQEGDQFHINPVDKQSAEFTYTFNGPGGDPRIITDNMAHVATCYLASLGANTAIPKNFFELLKEAEEASGLECD